MKVSELIEELKKAPKDAEVRLLARQYGEWGEMPSDFVKPDKVRFRRGILAIRERGTYWPNQDLWPSEDGK